MSATESRPNDVAIVGMTARLPGAEDLDQLWSNLQGGVESVTFLSPEKPVIRRGLAHVKAVPQLAGMELFDAGFFGFSPGEAETMDPQIRAFLECAWHALESAGCDPAQTPGRIGVFAGCGLSTYLTGHLLPNREVMRSARSGLSSLGQFNDRDALATIVSYKLDLTGPAVTVQTFCSTSLVAVHLACQSLLSGESDVALAGGAAVNPALSTGYVYQEGGILSPDGHTRSFDAQAGGTVFGNGVGAVVLKRLDDALAEGDVVHAVIRGSAINNDGGGGKAGYTAPSVVGQSKAIAEALAVAQVSPDAVSYVEAHGTATAIGDPIEIEALTRAFRTGTARKGFCAVGSVKTNFGHLDRAAGVAALIKTVLALEHQKLPPSLHFEQPNPKIDFDASPFVVNTTLREWPANGKPRVAGVNSLGVGGTNAHAIVEEAPVRPPSGPSRAAQLLVVSARTETALEAATERLVGLLRSSSAPPLPDLAFTLLAGRHRFEHRRFVVASTAAEAAERLGGGGSTPSWSGYSRNTERPVVFLFPGQGAQYPGMTRGLYDSEPAFKSDVDVCLDALGALGVDLRRALFPEPTEAAEAADRLRQTALAQPALFIVEYALARQLGRLGIEPQAMIGHSIGEYVAAHLAGVMSLEDALLLVAERGRLMQSLPPGSMLAVSLGEGELVPMLDGDLALAAVNAPRLSVVSGPTPEIEALEQRLQSMEAFTARLHTSHAFHSAMMEPILEEFEQRVARVALRAPQVPYVSNRTGTWIEDEQAKSPRYWAEHLRQTVRFASGVATLWEDPSRILLEVGPGNALTTLVKQQPPPEGEPAVASTVRHPRETRSDLEVLLAAVGRLWGEGARVLGQSVYAGEDRHRVELPLYPFERQRLWIDPPQPGTRADRLETARRPLSEWVYVPTWSSAPPPLLTAHSGEKPAPGDWLLFVDEEGIGAAVATRLRERGTSVITVAPGERFGGTPTEGYHLDPTARADYDRLLEGLSTAGRSVSRVVYGWGAGEAVAPDRLYYGLFFLAQALAARGLSAPLQLKVLTTGLHDVMRGDVIQPAKAPLLGLAKVIPQEQHDLTCASVDVEPAGSAVWQDDSALDLLVEELSADAPGVVAAHRQGQRWTQGFERLDLPAPADLPLRLRERGVYLITGGLGGVTFVLAAHLAQKVKARLVLTGRSALPRPEEWDAWLAGHDPADPVCLRIGRVRRLQELGAEVLVVRADAGDLDQMRAAVADAESRFGAIHGVIHGAGVVGGDTFRPLTQIGRTEIEAQFHAKVKGLEVLEQALGDRDVDFCMLTSSLSSVLGGFGYGAYAAANLYMDAFARARAGSGRWVSVNWDEWRLSGPVDETAAGSGLARFAMAPAEGAAVFARILETRGLSQVVVSSGDLAVRREQWIRLVGLRTKPAEGEKKEEARRHPRPNLHNPYVAASTATEKQIAAIWQQLLGMEKVGIHDNFFELGGHSLMAIQLVTEIRTRMDAEISVATLFEGPTVHSLSRLVEPEAAEPAVVDQSRERGERRKAESRRRQALREQSLP